MLKLILSFRRKGKKTWQKQMACTICSKEDHGSRKINNPSLISYFGNQVKKNHVIPRKIKAYIPFVDIFFFTWNIFAFPAHWENP